MQVIYVEMIFTRLRTTLIVFIGGSTLFVSISIFSQNCEVLNVSILPQCFAMPLCMSIITGCIAYVEFQAKNYTKFVMDKTNSV